MGKRLSKELKSGDRLAVVEEEGQRGWSRVSEGEEELARRAEGAGLTLWGTGKTGFYLQ